MSALGRMLFRLVLALCAALTFAAPIQAEDDFQIRDTHIRLEGGLYYLDAQLGLDFSEEALEALTNGVPLTLLVHVQVRRGGAWLWEDSLLDLQLRYAIGYKPLSERYEVYRLPRAGGRDFVTRDAALRALGDLRDLQLVAQDDLEPDTDYEVHIKVSLDIEELPLPLRPMAYLKPAWKLSSGWTKWPLAP